MFAPIRARLLSGVAPCLLTVLMAHAVPARATDAEQAGAMESQVRAALAGLLGPTVKLGDRPVLITPAGDHYDVVLPIHGAAFAATPPQDVRITGVARAGANGIWTIENVRMTSPVRVTVDVPAPAADARQDNDGKVPGKIVPMTYTVEQQGQDGRIVWDPSFATPSTWSIASQSTRAHSDGGSMSSDTSTGAANALWTLRPAGPGRVDVLLDGTVQDYQIDSKGSSNLRLAIERVKVASVIDGVDRSHGAALIQSVAAIIEAVRTGPALTGKAPDLSPSLVNTLLTALQDFASDAMMEETLDGFIMRTDGQTVAADHVRFGMDAASDKGLLRAGLNFGMDGLALPDMAAGDLAALVPRRIALRPVVGGVAITDLRHLASLSSEHKNPAPEDIAALFSHGGITGGIESMAVELGGATFTGHGTLLATAPSADAITGTATVQAENFDMLMQKVGASPILGQRALPVMLLMKGLGRAQDAKLVWDVAYRHGKVFVNDVDLAAMARGNGPAQGATPK